MLIKNTYIYIIYRLNGPAQWALRYVREKEICYVWADLCCHQNFFKFVLFTSLQGCSAGWASPAVPKPFSVFFFSSYLSSTVGERIFILNSKLILGMNFRLPWRCSLEWRRLGVDRTWGYLHHPAVSYLEVALLGSGRPML